MRTNDIIDIFVSYTESKSGKVRPVLIIQLTEKEAWILKITSKYKNKSKYIQKYYFPIFNWKKYGLDKASFIDTREYLILNLKDLNISKYRGHFTIEDLRALKKFIDKNSK